MKISLFSTCNDLHTMDNLGVCGGVPMQSPHVTKTGAPRNQSCLAGFLSLLY